MIYDLIQNLTLGFSVSLTLVNLGVVLIGAVVGTAIGVLPGLGPTATISLLLPVTLLINPTSAIIMLAGIFYGAMYGGSITSILVNIPGEAASVITCLDGYQMARRGRAGVALGISAFASFIAGAIATVGVATLAKPLASVALKIGPPEKAALLVFSLVLVATTVQGSRLRAYAMIALGLLLSTVGIDLVTGRERFTFGTSYLLDGLGIPVLAMGMFGISEMLMLAEWKERPSAVLPYSKRIMDLLPNRQDWRDSVGPIGRGTVIGFFFGLLPGGGGGLLGSFMSYVVEKRVSRTPLAFGHGAIAGVAGPESANNAGAQASFIPLLCLGIPSSAVIGVIMGALVMNGITPGPQLIVDHPDLFWGVVTSMFIGNAMLIVLNVPLIGIFVKLLQIPQAVMAPLIVMFCCIGAYSLNNTVGDVICMVSFGLIGYGLRKTGFELTPLLLSFLLGLLLEQSTRQALLMGYGSPMIFLERPIAAVFMFASVSLLLWPLFRGRFARKRETGT